MPLCLVPRKTAIKRTGEETDAIIQLNISYVLFSNQRTGNYSNQDKGGKWEDYTDKMNSISRMWPKANYCQEASDILHKRLYGTFLTFLFSNTFTWIHFMAITVYRRKGCLPYSLMLASWKLIRLTSSFYWNQRRIITFSGEVVQA